MPTYRQRPEIVNATRLLEPKTINSMGDVLHTYCGNVGDWHVVDSAGKEWIIQSDEFDRSFEQVIPGVHPSTYTPTPLVSIVIPYYKRIEQFRKVIFRNFVFQHPEIEVVIAMDEPSEEHRVLNEVIRPLSSKVRFRLIVNDVDHVWRPPCVAINVGIRNSVGRYVGVCSPESVLMLPRPDYLVDTIRRNEPKEFYLTGFFQHIHEPALEQLDNFSFGYLTTYNRFNPDRPYGFTLFRKEHAFKLCGYDERRSSWGGDDDDFRKRLDAIGIPRVHDRCLKVLHLWGETADRGAAAPYGETIVIPGQENFGTQFSRIAYDWLNHL